MKLINDYGLQAINAREAIDYGKVQIANSNAQIRTAATNLIVTIYQHAGDAILPLLADIKEATLKILHSEFENVTPIQANSYKEANECPED